MSIALNNRVKIIEDRLEAINAALSILLRDKGMNLDDNQTIRKMKDDIQGLKMRMGKVKELA